jgi:AIPR protein
VNGCQTSHVLYAEREFSKGVHVPFCLIVTADDEVARSITTATNQQTQVRKENLLALLDEQKAIEQYFNTYRADEGHRVYYERRSKQWAGSQQVRGAWRVITLQNLLQSFASMYQEVPHTAARYYGDLRDRARSEVFIAANHPAYFYSAAYAYCKLDQFLP